jgi:hypothetical protein
MARLFRPAVAAFLVGIVLALGVHGLSRNSGGVSADNAVAQTTTPSTAPTSKPSQPVTVSPLDTIQRFVDAVQAGDVDVVTTLIGGPPGSFLWCAKGLQGFIGHTTFKRFRSVITHNNGVNACVNVDGFMTFTDPSGFPAVKNTIHLYIDGDFKFKASGNDWVITKLPGYQEPLCDSPTHYGPDPDLFPWPGDAI